MSIHGQVPCCSSLFSTLLCQRVFSKIRLRTRIADVMPDSKDFNPTATVTAEPTHVSLEGMHSTVEVPHHDAGFWPKWRALISPAVLVSARYIDSGNSGTDFAARPPYKYGVP